MGWTWVSGDTPLGEETERYRLVLSSSGSQRTVVLTQPSYTYFAADQAADGLVGTLRIEVAQVGTHAVSRAVRINFA